VSELPDAKRFGAKARKPTAELTKQCYEAILLARKPLEGTLAENLAHHGTGALNIEACREEESGRRYPANLIFSHLPDCEEERCAKGCPVVELNASAEETRLAGATGTPASLFFYCPKVSRAERDAGCEGLPERPLDLFPGSSGKSAAKARNHHPTVKPLALMRRLVSLATPSGGTVLDPYCGSGSTGCAAVMEGRCYLGIEREAEFAEIARARIAQWTANSPGGMHTNWHRARAPSPGKGADEPRQVELCQASIDLIAEAVAQRLGQAQAEPGALLSASEVAIRYGVE